MRSNSFFLIEKLGFPVSRGKTKLENTECLYCAWPNPM